MRTVQITTPPPPFPTLLHCVIDVIGSADVVVVVLQVPPPEAMTPAAPVQAVMTIVDGAVGTSVPAPVR